MMSCAPFYVSVGRNVRRLRLKAEMRQADLAIKLGLTRTSVVNIEGGNQRYLAHVLFDLADALGASIPDLVGDFENGAALEAFARTAGPGREV